MAAVVVTYRPELPLLRENIAAALPQVGLLIVVDNSDANSEVSNEYAADSRVRYLGDGRNKGLGAALNIGVRLARAEGYEWLLTLDQDSVLPEFYVADLLSAAAENDLVIASISGMHTGEAGRQAGAASVDTSVRYLITSGNLTRLDALADIGGFREEFFIDYLDYDLSIRLLRKGYLLASCHVARFRHNLGAPSAARVLGKSVTTSNHSALRRYYIYRNRLVFYRENLVFAPRFVVSDAMAAFKDLLKIALVEQHRTRKLMAIGRGLYDGMRRKLGPAPSNL